MHHIRRYIGRYIGRHRRLVMAAFGTGTVFSLLLLAALGQQPRLTTGLAVAVAGALALTVVPWRWLWPALRNTLTQTLSDIRCPPHPAADAWLQQSPTTAQDIRRLRKQKLRYSFALGLAMALLGLLAALVDATTVPGSTMLHNTPLLLLFTWGMLGLGTLFWQVRTTTNAAAALRITLRRCLYELQHPRAVAFDPPLRLSLLYLAELALVLSIGYFAASIYIRSDPTQQLRGIEAEWLTSYLYQAHFSLRDEGYISLWNPWFEYGEPLLANPFSFLLNPFSTIPGLLYGGAKGILQSIVLYAMLAGAGGWFLGRVLGLSSLGRVALGVLLVGKGNMHAMIGMGYFQLGVAQAFMPWAVAGFLATAYYPHKRWPPVLLAVAMALMFWAGNVWHTLPTILSLALLAITHLLWLARPVEKWLVAKKRRLDWQVLRGWAFAAVLTVGLAAITLVPIWLHQDRIGAHPPFNPDTETVDLWRVLAGFWSGAREPWFNDGIYANQSHFYYSYVAPAGLLLLLFVLVPPVWPWTYRAGQAAQWRVWAAGAVLVAFFTVWATADNWLLLELYARFELLREWRFVGRALATAAFWVAVLVALRVDGLVRAIFQPIFSRTWRRTLYTLGPQLLTLAALTVVLFPPLSDGVKKWEDFGWTEDPRHADSVCAAWLRAQFPDEPLAVFRPKYDATTAFLDNRIRLTPIEADFEMLPDASTLGPPLGPLLLPRFGFAWAPDEHAVLRSLGYAPWPASPTPREIFPEFDITGLPCVWQHPDAAPYTFALPVDYLQALGTTHAPLDHNQMQPVMLRHRDTDDIHLHIDTPRDTPTAVIVQELAYPGWRAYVDGERVAYESVGGMLGVVVPAGDSAHDIRFHFRPTLTYRMAGVTLLTIAFVIAYLLRLEKAVLWAWQRWRARSHRRQQQH